MKSSELRIGNIVTIDNPNYWPQLKGIPVKVVSISIHPKGYSIGCNLLNERDNITSPMYGQFLKYIKPIELTEEILEKVGFEKIKMTNSDGKSYHRFTNNYFSTTYIGDQWRFVNSFGMMHKSLSSLHQLQNLFFILEGHELDVSKLLKNQTA